MIVLLQQSGIFVAARRNTRTLAASALLLALLVASRFVRACWFSARMAPRHWR